MHHTNKPKYTPKYITIGGQKFTYFHFTTFTLTFVCYSLFHATRKTFSNVKTSVSETWTGTCDAHNRTCVSLKPDDLWNGHSFFGEKADAKFFLGVLDASFLGAYSLGLFISGILGDRFDLRLVLTLGMTLSAVAMFLFGVVSEWLQVYSEFWYLSFWILSGFAQSTGWPAVVAVMGNWFGQNGRGFIFGVWSANASVGNIIGALMVSAFLGYGYQYAFMFTSTVLFAGGVVVFFGLVPHPNDIGLPDPDAVESSVDNVDGEATDEIVDSSQREPLLNNREPAKPIGFIQALLLPGVILYSLCYACLKMVNYSFLFWLPYYLSNKFNWHEEVADQISIWYDIGGIFGGIIGGVISDQIKKRSVVIFTMLTIALPSLYIFSESSDSQAMNAFLMTIVGFFIGGAANIISAAITADLGKQVQGSAEGLATVTGIVDGTGSVGAAVGQLLVPAIQNAFNWFYVFYFFIVLCVLTNVCILPLFVREVRELIVQFRSRARAGYRQVNSAETE